jgi:Acetyl-coenzyme A synthetase N-terminus
MAEDPSSPNTTEVYPVPEAMTSAADGRTPHVSSMARYEEMYAASLADPQTFWAQMANEHLTFVRPFDEKRVCEGSMAVGDVRWFPGASLNVCYNCVDRHAATRGDQLASRCFAGCCCVFFCCRVSYGRPHTRTTHTHIHTDTHRHTRTHTHTHTHYPHYTDTHTHYTHSQT